ncbi:putative quinol monooxygenase [Pseudoruegeria sp. SHC-113]|uniref:putative quinol monooxygenase n=1 Tax=Pseudoruegeria sp. SHC-113 TaxID=2855439 RepID=UPI0021BA5B74|nr:putative quinol monooxygenase [Pseudoruegeria sp. SHC-113]MCT8159440.1 antibiotic biosynthesis monooxygenase [Pseudoruegeria sp. SHC-113]
MFAVTVTFTLKPGQMEAFLPLMLANARTSLEVEPGCLQFDTCRNAGGDEIFLYEIYTDRAAFDTHLASPHFKAFDAEVADMVAAKQVALFDEVLR